jgi:hypothetical protein
VRATGWDSEKAMGMATGSEKDSETGTEKEMG